jgi:hypothetical protein
VKTEAALQLPEPVQQPQLHPIFSRALASGLELMEIIDGGDSLPYVSESTASERAPVHAGQPARLRDLGYDEIWLQNWLAGDPRRLGLGEVTVLAQELTQPRGGSLDILAASSEGDTYYSVEVQLGEVDAPHGFRVFDYWAANRARSPGKRHVAVLMAESAAGRYRQALEALAEFVPLLVIEMRIWRGVDEAIVVPETVIANESLDVAGTAGPVGGRAREREDWVSEATDEAMRFVEEFVDWTQENLGEVRVDYSPQSYIGVRRGRRVWAPLWLRLDGAMVYLPDPDSSREEQPSVAFEYFEERLRGAGLEPAWIRTYNAGANRCATASSRRSGPAASAGALARQLRDPRGRCQPIL